MRKHANERQHIGRTYMYISCIHFYLHLLTFTYGFKCMQTELQWLLCRGCTSCTACEGFTLSLSHFRTVTKCNALCRTSCHLRACVQSSVFFRTMQQRYMYKAVFSLICCVTLIGRNMFLSLQAGGTLVSKVIVIDALV